MQRRRRLTLARNALGMTVLVGTTLLVGVGSATAAPLTTQAGSCPAGYTCAFDLHNLAGALIWASPECGLINLGSRGLGDRISSIVNNRGRGTVQALNWGASAGWLKVSGEVDLGWRRDYIGADDNITDAVIIGC